MDNTEAISYLQSLLNRQLRVHTTDTRMFIGQLKCTDKDRNIILAGTHEYRHPPSSAVMAAVEQQAEDGMTRLNMSSRFVGLVVVPGAYITKIEVEEHPLEGIGEGER
ncbi:MAG: hypothetical protein M1813_002272 [Trichoglossum hirsutum]|nr:MAG: hypothetical protein M1813_002272 [Trichoglossum hirsutum]